MGQLRQCNIVGLISPGLGDLHTLGCSPALAWRLVNVNSFHLDLFNCHLIGLGAGQCYCCWCRYLAIRSWSWLTRKEGGRAATPPCGIVISSLKNTINLPILGNKYSWQNIRRIILGNKYWEMDLHIGQLLLLLYINNKDLHIGQRKPRVRASVATILERHCGQDNHRHCRKYNL